MGKKKKEIEVEEFSVDIDKINDEIKKQYGDLVVRDVVSILESPPLVIPVSPVIDLNICGGITEGTAINLSGPPKAGKTLTALAMAAAAQQPKYGGEFAPDGREVFYYNVEGRLKKRDIEGIKGLNIDKFHVIGSQRGKLLTAQEYLSIADKLILSVPGSVHIIDSYGALCTENEYNKDMDGSEIADGARLLKKFWRKTCNSIPVNKGILIGIQHLYSKIKGMGGAVEAGGNGPAYGSDLKLRATWFEPLTVGDKKEEEDAVQVGQKIHWKIVWSALGPPGGKCTSFIRYGVGIDKERELFEIGQSLGLITKSGAWYEFAYLDDSPQYQGAEKSRQALVDNPEWADKLNKQFREMMNLPCL